MAPLLGSLNRTVNHRTASARGTNPNFRSMKSASGPKTIIASHATKNARKWDIIVLTLMLGGFASAVTGFYLAIQRIRHDVVLLFRFIARRKVAIAQKGDAVRIRR
jgi:hypothetical protein